MRKFTLIAPTVLLAVFSAVVLVPAQAAEDDPAKIGEFSPAFREDGDPESGDTAGCKPGADGLQQCLPAAASSVVLPNGKILYWNALEGTENVQNNAVLEGGDVTVDDQSRVLTLNPEDPAASAWALTDPVAGGGNPDGNVDSEVGAPEDAARNDGGLFCTAHVHLPDGRVLVVGGTDYYQDPRVTDSLGVIELEGLKAARIFNPADNSWVKAGTMNWGRWYPSALTLPDGDIFVASGVTKLIKPVYTDEKNMGNSGGNVRQTETYNQESDKWEDNGPSGERSLPLYPRIHLLPNGNVYYDAAGQVFNPAGYSYDEAFWNMAATYDPGTKEWSDLGIPGMGTVEELGFRGSTFSLMLPLKAPYTTASFLSAGGILGTTPGTVIPTASSRINTVTLGEDGSEALTTTVTDPLNERRWYSSGVLLPDGSALAVSGATLDEVVAPGDGQAVRGAELFTPDGEGGGSWAPVASISKDRTYHNTAVLLPDGRVLVGGHSPIPNNYSKVMTFPGGFSNNSRDASFEIYSPPYLFKGPRPSIGVVDQEIDYGQRLTIPTDDAEQIESVVLVRNPSVTHLVDSDQRSVELPITGKSGGAVQVSVPESKAVLPAGPYMLFINKRTDAGLVPSVSRQVYAGASFPKYLGPAAGAAVLGATAAAGAPDAGRSGTLPATGAASTAPIALGALGGAIVVTAVRRTVRLSRSS